MTLRPPRRFLTLYGRRGMHKSGFICLAALCQSPQNATAIVKSGVIQVVVQVLSDDGGADFASNEMTERAISGLQLLRCLASSSDGVMPYRECPLLVHPLFKK